MITTSTTKLGPPSPCNIRNLGGKGEYFKKWSQGAKTLEMTSEPFGEVFVGHFADMCSLKLPLVFKGGRADLPSISGREARTSIGASGRYFLVSIKSYINLNMSCSHG